MLLMVDHFTLGHELPSPFATNSRHRNRESSGILVSLTLLAQLEATAMGLQNNGLRQSPRSQIAPECERKRKWDRWDSNPEPKDYESSALTD